MLKLLTKIFVKDAENVSDPKVRQAYGNVCGFYGIFLNLVLFAGKYFAGFLSGSVAIMADAFNNLSDAGSSIITLLGFALSGRKPDPEHPFGHGRIEYLAGLALSAMIIFMGFELGKSSFQKIIHPEAVQAGLVPALILVFSILVKFYMSLYNRKIGKKINSAAMQATATDSLSDSVSTAVVLLAMGIQYFFNINIDGYAGILVALFIFYAGFTAMKEVLGPILGQAPDPQLVSDIEEIIRKSPVTKGIHGLIVHDYGPGRLFISVHVEVDGKEDIYSLHNAIDIIEKELESTLDCGAVIHMDPLKADDEETQSLRIQILEAVQEKIDSRIDIHDFRIVPGRSHTNIIFDAFVPFDLEKSEKELTEEIIKVVSGIDPEFHCILKIDRK